VAGRGGPAGIPAGDRPDIFICGGKRTGGKPGKLFPEIKNRGRYSLYRGIKTDD
jgi:hypothetical protein